jgi:spiro-SPASM protein
MNHSIKGIMKTYSCILLPTLTKYYQEPLDGFGSYGSALAEYIQALGPYDQVFLYPLNPNQSSEFYFKPFLSEFNPIKLTADQSVASTWSSCLASLVNQIGAEVLTSATMTDSVEFCFADSPFLNPSISGQVRSLFRQYKADYAFSDGYPLGLAQEILSLQRLQGTLSLAHQFPLEITRSGLFELIQKDINSYHIETKISGEDHRLTRLELNGSTKRSHLLVQRLSHQVYKNQFREPWDDISFEQVFRETTNSHRTLPAAAHLQIVAACPFSCSYCPYPLINPGHQSDTRYLSFHELQRMIQSLTDLMPEGTISLSTFGEPSLHPQIGEILRYLDDQTPYSVVVETTGVGWDIELLDKWINEPFQKTKFIISLDSKDKQVYHQLGKNYFDQALSWAHKMIESFPNTVFVQALRLKGYEKDLLEFYQYWSEKTSQVIIQKYDSYAGFLPDRKVVDLQPVTRFPCWHLKRELYIGLEGDVTMCKEDVKGETVQGNILTDDPLVLWDRLAKYYEQHRTQNVPELCKACDEYYTYNY